MAKLIPEMFVPAGPALSGGPLLADRLLPVVEAAPPSTPTVWCTKLSSVQSSTSWTTSRIGVAVPGVATRTTSKT